MLRTRVSPDADAVHGAGASHSVLRTRVGPGADAVTGADAVLSRRGGIVPRVIGVTS